SLIITFDAGGVRGGIAGATGYAGVELVRLLARHPGVRLTTAMGSPGSEPRRVRALSRAWEEPIAPLDVDILRENCDAVVLALPEQASASVALELLRGGARVFDLSGAFRLTDRDARRHWYPHTPDAPI